MLSTEQCCSRSSTAILNVGTHRRKRKVQNFKIDLAQLEKLFGMPLYEAAHTLGVSTTTVKKKCRQFGIKSWPRTTRNKTEKDIKDEKMNNTSSVDQQQHRASRLSCKSPAAEPESSDSEGTSDTSIPTGSNSASDGSFVGVQKSLASKDEDDDVASDNCSGGSENQSTGDHLSLGMSLSPLPLAPVNAASHGLHISNRFPTHISMTAQSPAQFALSHSPAHFSSQGGAFLALSISNLFSNFLASLQPTPKEQAAAIVSRETKNLHLLQQKTELQMLLLQRAELDLKIQSLQQSFGLGFSAPVGSLPNTASCHGTIDQARSDVSSIALS